MVFNFVNSEKDVDHIENDGLDMSKRRNLKNSKVRIIFFSEKVSFCSTQFLLEHIRILKCISNFSDFNLKNTN